ncbi:MAG: PKD domain-containing protein, partial [Bacteroidales bacterium]|nr:PKD domain-containing protein [Bacteroidales bacterium]
RTSFNDFKVEPSEGVWKKINGKLNLKQFLSPDFKHFNAYYLIAIIGIVAVMGVLFSNNTVENNQVSDAVVQKSNNELNDNSTINNLTITQHSKDSNSAIKLNENKHAEKKTAVKIESSRVSEVIPITQNQKLESVINLSKDSLTRLNQIKVLPPKPLFKLLNKEGCAPFEIKLQNFSKLAQNFEWSFGDGNTSKEISPGHIYLYPGVYTITLKATGNGGVAYSVIDSIIVHENISTKLSKSFDNKLFEDELFSIDSKSDQPAEYQWDFGDGYYSDEKRVTHAYKDKGNYTITLKTWTANNCYDSIKVADVEVLASKNKISFPNAFIPNMGGPSSGKYFNREIYNDIFHPKVKGEVAEYSLKIYSRTGALIFESNDINIGWDGYYQNRLMPEGVYPFIASGKFEDGQNYTNRGNITIIHRK